MAEKILKSEEIVVSRREPNFDRACDDAYNRTVSIFGITDCGHSNRVKDWDRSSCCIRVVFVGYEHTGGMGGHECHYIFRGEAVQCDDNDE